jgi:hypothetical protein
MSRNCKHTTIGSLIAVSICALIAANANAQVTLTKDMEFVAYANAPQTLHRTLIIKEVDKTPTDGKYNFKGSYSFTWAGNKNAPSQYSAAGFFAGYYTEPNAAGQQSIVFQCDQAVNANSKPDLAGQLQKTPPAGASADTQADQPDDGEPAEADMVAGTGPAGIVAVLTTQDPVGQGATDETEYEVH